MVRMVIMTFAVVTGLSWKHLVKTIGIKISHNAWTRWIKKVGLVTAESLERNRRNPDNKYECAQIDETAFGKRKYNWGARRRKGGVQWGLTIVEVDQLTGKR